MGKSGGNTCGDNVADGQMESVPDSRLNKSASNVPTRGLRRADIALVGMYEVSKLLAVPARLETSFSGVLQLLASFLDMRHGLIALLDGHGVPEIVVGTGWSDANAKRYFDRLPEKAIGRIVATKMPLIIRQMKKDPLFENWDFSGWDPAQGDFSFIGVPIKDRGNVIGTLTIDREFGDGAKNDCRARSTPGRRHDAKGRPRADSGYHR
jgi:Nif-specific regulatory protein